MPPRQPSKRDVLVALLQQSPTVFVSFDPRQERVVLPAPLRRPPRLLLQYGLNMPVPIPDLDIGLEGIGGTLSFGGSPSWTFVPWAAIFAMICDDEKHGMVWEEDIPKDLVPPRGAETAPVLAPAGPSLEAAPAKRSGAIRAVESPPALPAPLAVVGGRAKKSSAPKREKKKAVLRSVPTAAEAAAPAAPAPKAKPQLVLEREARVAAAERAPAAASMPSVSGSDTAQGNPNDEIVELPTHEKKKRELPSYLRVVK